VAASIRQCLLNLSRERGEDFNLVLTQYGLERWLYRLERSDHSGRFVLKEAMLFRLWTGRSHRPSSAVDVLITVVPSMLYSAETLVDGTVELARREQRLEHLDSVISPE